MQKIMFNDSYGLTQAVIDGRKTMTRRAEFSDAVQKLLTESDDVYMDADDVVAVFDSSCENVRLSPRYQLDEVVAVAQRYADIPGMENMDGTPGWRNKMFTKAELMPYRIRITGIRAERLQDISDEDCIKEGLEWHHIAKAFYVRYNSETNSRIWLGNTPLEAFAKLIDKVSGSGTWASNPWVVVYEFELVK